MDKQNDEIKETIGEWKKEEMGEWEIGRFKIEEIDEGKKKHVHHVIFIMRKHTFLFHSICSRL